MAITEEQKKELSQASATLDFSEMLQSMQDAVKILPVEMKAASQGRKPHKNEILMSYSIKELKDAIKMKKAENVKLARERRKYGK